MARLPTPGADSGTWGTILNDFLGVAHNSDGSLKPVGTSGIADSAVTAAKLSVTLDQISTAAANVSLGSHQITNVTDPTNAQDAATKAYADTKLTKAGDTMTGKLAEAVVALTDAATLAVNAASGNIFTVTLVGDRIIGNPTNPTSGQKIIFRLTQDVVGSRIVTWSADYRFGVDITQPVLTTTASKTDYVGFIYNAEASKWDCVALARGY